MCLWSPYEKDNDTPLHAACAHGSDQVAVLMLDYGGDINAKNKVHHICNSFILLIW